MQLKDAGIYDLNNIFKGKPTALHSNSQGTIIDNCAKFINIPAYQRPYRWGDNNINKLFDDYEENEGCEYFLGSAVAVRKDSKKQCKMDIVDGQQRLTTLYLLSYIRFLLMRKCYLKDFENDYNPYASQKCLDLKNAYVDIIGKNATPFDNIDKKLKEITKLNQDKRVETIVRCYKKELAIEEQKSTPELTEIDAKQKLTKFLKKDKLCLKYTRDRYNEILKEALSSVYIREVIGTNNFELHIIETKQNNEFLKNYLNALSVIFKRIWERALTKSGKNASNYEIATKAIEVSKDMIDYMSLCVVVSENEEDANKLFEVLNDRALEVEDIELIKNHFYKEYCTKSKDSDTIKDKNIAKLDELWADKIFVDSCRKQKRKLISYLTTVYLTKNVELNYKDNTKMKDSIKKDHSEKHYSSKYNYENILQDFNAYYAVKIILDKFDYSNQKTNALCLKAEASEKSITYKAFHLLNAFEMHNVISALVNVIISSYVKDGKSLDNDNFENDFNNFVVDLINDNTNKEKRFVKIHKCAHMLWVAAIKAKNYELPLNISKRIISKYWWGACDSGNIDFEKSEIEILNSEFDEWLNNWSFNNKKTLMIKVLLLNLLYSRREPDSNGYKKDNVTLTFKGGLKYTLDPSKLQLDHLEANNINQSNKTSYFKYDDIEERQKIVNGSIGNFMILDYEYNDNKNNIPLKDAISFYDNLKLSWLVKDIASMLKDKKYFETASGVPKDTFFKTRSIHLKKYFKAFLDKGLDKDTIVVNLK